MRILIMDTSSDVGVLALVIDGAVVAERRLPNGPELSKHLSGSTKLLVDPRPDQIVVGEGPGSLTGVRVGLALAQGLALGWRIPLIRVGSLFGFPEELVVIDVRSGGLCVREGTQTPRLLPPQEAEAEFAGRPIYSPHPERILARAPSLQCTASRLDPLSLLNKSAALL